MTIEAKIKGFRTKLRVDKKHYPKQYNYLNKVANACLDVQNWYVVTCNL